MKINLYERWINYPEGYNRPFKTTGSPKLYLDTEKHRPVKILARLSKIANRPKIYDGKSIGNRKYLVILKDKDYENSLTGSGQEIYKFVRDCLADEGLMSKSWGRRK